MGGLSASAAFREHLRRLGLGEFPCGAGSWNRSRFELRKRKPRGNAAQTEADAGTAQHQEIGTPSEESLETLMEFVSSQDSPWALPPDCSPEDQHLRELAVQSPQLIRDNFLFLFFRSLRIVDKGVNKVDENLLKFHNLEELILSANQISRINSAHLPRTLKGNPLVLIPGYRGFVIDSLPKLCILDDRNISPDEKHQFHGLSSKPDLIVNKAQLVVSVGKIKGIPNPIKLEELESSPESPVITHSYYVTYEFVEREKAEDTNNAEVLDLFTGVSATGHASQCFFHVSHDGGSLCSGISDVPEYRQVPFSPCNLCLCADLARIWPLLEIPLMPFSNSHLTPRKPWAETIECSHRKEHVTGDLVALKAFLMAGTTVTVVEEKVNAWHVLSWPIAAALAEDGGKKGKADKGKAEEKPKDGGKKKKKESPVELRSDPPLLRSLGSGHVNLESLLTGDQLVAVMCDFGVLITEETTQPPSPKEKVPSWVVVVLIWSYVKEELICLQYPLHILRSFTQVPSRIAPR
uniref:Leucine rich repeat containing 43 n=1 Tax=Gopherus evgoodei TaxID=1825980 RepID=A0A8C4YR93_9SAUR